MITKLYRSLALVGRLNKTQLLVANVEEEVE